MRGELLVREDPDPLGREKRERRAWTRMFSTGQRCDGHLCFSVVRTILDPIFC